jgi:hypothetical protein
MHDSGAALAEPDDAPLSQISLGAGSSGGASLRLGALLDTRLVRAELTRLRLPRHVSGSVRLVRAPTAHSQGTNDGGRLR